MIIRRKNDKWDEPGAGSHYKTIAARAHVCVPPHSCEEQ